MVTVVVQPTAVPATATATMTPTATAGAVYVPPKPTSAGKLEFTLEFAPTKRKGDNKIQLTVILHITGGAPPFQVLEEGKQQVLTTRVDGVQYTREWHNCGETEPVTIVLISGDGQKASRAIILPYDC